MVISLSTGLVSLWDRKRGRQGYYDEGKKNRDPMITALDVPHIPQTTRKAAAHTSQRNNQGQMIKLFTFMCFPQEDLIQPFCHDVVQVPLWGDVCPRSPWGPLTSTVPTLHTVTVNQTLILQQSVAIREVQLASCRPTLVIAA